MGGQLCFDALSGQVSFCVGGSGGGGGDFVAVEAIYFGKHGNDGNTGKSYAQAKLTLAAAIAAAVAGVPASGNQFALVCEDAGTYVESGLTLPNYVHLHAPDARFQSGGPTWLTIGSACTLRIGTLYLTAGTGIVQTGGAALVWIETAQANSSSYVIDSAGNSLTARIGQLTMYNGIGVRVTSTTPLVSLRFGTLLIGGTGVGVHQYGGGSFAGETAVDVDVVRLGVSGATAFQQSLNGNGLKVRAGAIRRGYGVAGTTAFNLNNNRICAVVGEIDVATVVNSGVNTELDLFVGKMTGAVTGAGTHNITEAGKFPNPAGYVHGFDLRWTGVSTGTVGTGGLLSSCRDSTDTFDIEVSGTLAFNITVSGANGLQSGQVEAPNTWYEVHAIADSTGVNPVACLLIPFGVAFSQAGYDKHRRVGWVRNNGSSNLRKFLAVGLGSLRWYWWDDDASNLTFLAGGTATSWTTVSCAAFAPPNAEQLEIRYDYAPANTFDDFGIRPVGAASTSRANTPFNIQPVIDAQTEGQSIRAQMPGLCNSSQQMEYETQSGGPLSLQVIAFADEV
jgi:hypothetical protein